MVSTDAGRARETAAEYLGIVDNVGGIVGWIDEIEPGDREEKIIKFFRAIIPDCGMQKAKIFSFVDEVLDHLHRIADYHAFITVGLESRRLLSERFGESPDSVKLIDGLLASASAAEPSDALRVSLESLLPSVDAMRESLRSMAEVAGIEPGEIQSATSIMDFAEQGYSKFRDRRENGEDRDARDAFYNQINAGGDINALDMARERYKSANDAFTSDLKVFEDCLEKAIAAKDEVSKNLDLLLAGSINTGVHRERSLAVIAALRHLRIAHDVPLYILMPVAEGRIAGLKAEGVYGPAGTAAVSPFIKELVLAIDDRSKGAMCIAALLAEKLSTDSLVRNA